MRKHSLGIRVSRILPCLILIDLMLFPYIRFLSCSLSMLLLLGWYGLNLPYAFKQKSLIGICAVVIISLAVCFLTYGKIMELSAAVIFIFTFMLCFFYKKELWIKGDLLTFFQKLLEVYLCIAFVFAAIYTVSPDLYFNLRSLWTMGGTEIEYSTRIINRYTFLFSDPNNAGCMFAAIMAYLVLFGSKDGKKQVMYLVLGSVCSIATFSVTAVGLLLAVYFLLIATRIHKRKWLLRAVIFLAVLVFVLIFAMGMGMLDGLMNNEMVRSLMWRIETNSSSGTTLGGRTSLWEDAVERALVWYNFFIGKGAVADADGVLYPPHSGHLFILICYGAIANILFYLKLCFLGKKAKWEDYIPLLPCFAIFTINTGMNDYRFMSLYACLFIAVFTMVRRERSAAAVRR